MKPKIQVVGAAFIEDNKIFAVRRSYGSSQVIHKYEFVGGKVEKNENEPEALKRECLEEMDLQIAIQQHLGKCTYEYEDKIVELSIYLCKMLSAFHIKEHEEWKWMPFSEINIEEWAPADQPFLEEIIQHE